ncbi:IS66 family insertion sequence element accessory protein TnpA [Desulfatitalea tepidiphila]|uniref:IS66 family insertion sequence element accessory protein TnpA n=1 Tax=Desulfatitalea tepidiphila TaxID=1185843 RepID=UPI0006B5E7BF
MTDGNTLKQDRAARRQFWQRHIRAWRDSGLSQAAYCREYAPCVESFELRLHSSIFYFWSEFFNLPPTGRRFGALISISERLDRPMLAPSRSRFAWI